MSRPMIAIRSRDATVGRSVARSSTTVLAGSGGAAALVGAGYVDPGNWGTDLAAGAGSGYLLIWVLGGASIVALYLQQLAVRLGIGSGSDLATLLHIRTSGAVRRMVTTAVLAAVVVTELVEVLGVVIGVELLTGWPPPAAVTAAATLSLIVLSMPARTGRTCVYGCLAMVTTVYLTLLAAHGSGHVIGGLRPRPIPTGDLPIALGILGAVVMPHNLLLHSSLGRDLDIANTSTTARGGGRALLRSCLISSVVALALAWAVNCSILSIGAQGGTGAAAAQALGTPTAQTAQQNPAVALLFAVTLIGAGLASSITGGLVATDTFARFAPGLGTRVLTRRMCCLLPVLVVSLLPIAPAEVLVWSQVLLFATLPVVVAPLVWFVTDTEIMSTLCCPRGTRIAGLTLVAGMLAAQLAAFSLG